MITNRKAHFQYHILEEYEAGIILLGSEVKSIRAGKMSLDEAYCFIQNGEMFLKNSFIAKYFEASWLNHEEKRDKKLLLHKREINKILKQTKDRGITVIPLSLYEKKGRFKLSIGIAKGKKLFDKRQSIKEKDIKRDNERNN